MRIDPTARRGQQRIIEDAAIIGSRWYEIRVAREKINMLWREQFIRGRDRQSLSALVVLIGNAREVIEDDNICARFVIFKS